MKTRGVTPNQLGLLLTARFSSSVKSAFLFFLSIVFVELVLQLYTSDCKVNIILFPPTIMFFFIFVNIRLFV